jgi:hypothetical protein
MILPYVHHDTDKRPPITALCVRRPAGDERGLRHAVQGGRIAGKEIFPQICFKKRRTPVITMLGMGLPTALRESRSLRLFSRGGDGAPFARFDQQARLCGFERHLLMLSMHWRCDGAADAVYDWLDPLPSFVAPDMEDRAFMFTRAIKKRRTESALTRVLGISP